MGILGRTDTSFLLLAAIVGLFLTLVSESVLLGQVPDPGGPAFAIEPREGGVRKEGQVEVEWGQHEYEAGDTVRVRFRYRIKNTSTTETRTYRFLATLIKDTQLHTPVSSATHYWTLGPGADIEVPEDPEIHLTLGDPVPSHDTPNEYMPNATISLVTSPGNYQLLHAVPTITFKLKNDGSSGPGMD